MKRSICEGIGIIVIVAVLATVTGLIHPQLPAWYRVAPSETAEFEVSVEDVKGEEWADAFWIDARATKDYEAEHFKNAISLNDSNFEDQLWENSHQFTDLDRLIIVYCDGLECQRSTKIAKLLRERLLLRQVYVLKGDWRHL